LSIIKNNYLKLTVLANDFIRKANYILCIFKQNGEKKHRITAISTMRNEYTSKDWGMSKFFANFAPQINLF